MSDDKVHVVRVSPADGFWVVAFAHGAYTRERDFLALPDVLSKRMAVIDMPANQRKVQLFHHTAASRRNVTLNQWKDCVRSHGVDRAAETFWRLGVKD